MTKYLLDQKYRSAAVSTPLGENVLVLHRFEGKEELGRPFEYQLELLSYDCDIDFNQVVGTNVTVRLDQSDKQQKYFNGFVSRFAHVATEEGEQRLARYRATVVPWLWFLTRATDCRIFQDTTVPDIIKQVFRDYGLAHFQDSLTREYRVWEYCVQYRETAFHFISRLMEQEGIYYFFKHENGKHTLVLADSASAHEHVPSYEQVPYYPPTREHRAQEWISEWIAEQAFVSTEYSFNDFNFKTPKTPLEVRVRSLHDHPVAEFKVYDYPGEYRELAEGEECVRVRMEADQAGYKIFRAKANTRGLTTGCCFKLARAPRGDDFREYLVISATYNFRCDDFESSGDADDEDPFYVMTFTAIESDHPFRLARTTPLPYIRGPQTATVVGRPGDEIMTDEFGRVKVHFPWDRHDNSDQNSSCWIRVSQTTAGKGWGNVSIPRVGQEVIVEFLEGDPDRPIITGRVYNRDSMPPYPLPANATQTGMKSNSTKGSGGSNEIRMEDKKGDEQLYIHAQKDQQIVIGNDSSESVTHDQAISIGNNASEEVGVDKIIRVGANLKIVAGTSITLQCGPATIHMNQAGVIRISGTMVSMVGSINVDVAAPITVIGAAALLQGGLLSVNAGLFNSVLGDLTTLIQGGVVKINP